MASDLLENLGMTTINLFFKSKISSQNGLFMATEESRQCSTGHGMTKLTSKEFIAL
jgi:hypothetical protein